MSLQNIRDLLPRKTWWDKGEKGSVKGLQVRAFAKGNKGFYLYYRTKSGIQRRPKLGDVTEISLADARKRAKAIMDKVASGEDPKADWDETRAELTIQDLYERVLEKHWSSERFKRSGYYAEVKSKWNVQLKDHFGSIKISQLKMMYVKEWHQRLSDQPVTANRSLAVLSKLFTYAEEMEYRPQGTNPCMYVARFTERQRKRYPTEEECKRIFAILEREKENYPFQVAHLKLLLYTGSRPRAIERAQWEDLEVFELNGERYGILTFHGKSTQKTGEEETVVFPPQAMEVVDALPKIRGRSITGMKLPARFWERVREEAGVPDLWARDFRRLFATVGMSNGVNPTQITELLNHHSAQTTKRYAKLMHGSKVQAAMQIASKLDEIVSGPVHEGMVN